MSRHALSCHGMSSGREGTCHVMPWHAMACRREGWHNLLCKKRMSLYRVITEDRHSLLFIEEESASSLYKREPLSFSLALRYREGVSLSLFLSLSLSLFLYISLFLSLSPLSLSPTYTEERR